MYLPRRYWSIYCITFTINCSSSIFQSSQKFNSSNPLLEPVNLKVRFQIYNKAELEKGRRSLMTIYQGNLTVHYVMITQFYLKSEVLSKHISLNADL